MKKFIFSMLLGMSVFLLVFSMPALADGTSTGEIKDMDEECEKIVAWYEKLRVQNGGTYTPRTNPNGGAPAQ